MLLWISAWNQFLKIHQKITIDDQLVGCGGINLEVFIVNLVKRLNVLMQKVDEGTVRGRHQMVHSERSDHLKMEQSLGGHQ